MSRSRNGGALALGLVNFVLTLAWTVVLCAVHFNFVTLIFEALSGAGAAIYVSFGIIIAGLMSACLCVSGGARAFGGHNNAVGVSAAAFVFQFIFLALLCVWMYLFNGWAMFVSNWQFLVIGGTLTLFTFVQIFCSK